jgi:predicted nucleic acid-binding protein
VQYWDTSALLKLYAAEADSFYFLQLLAASDAAICTSIISSIELQCALYRKELAGDCKPGATAAAVRRFEMDVAAGRIITVPLGNDVVRQAGEISRRSFTRRRPAMIRSLDVIHLSSAAVAGADSIVATDARLREAARRAGLALIPAE